MAPIKYDLSHHNVGPLLRRDILAKPFSRIRQARVYHYNKLDCFFGDITTALGLLWLCPSLKQCSAESSLRRTLARAQAALTDKLRGGHG